MLRQRAKQKWIHSLVGGKVVFEKETQCFCFGWGGRLFQYFSWTCVCCFGYLCCLLPLDASPLNNYIHHHQESIGPCSKQALCKSNYSLTVPTKSTCWLQAGEFTHRTQQTWSPTKSRHDTNLLYVSGPIKFRVVDLSLNQRHGKQIFRSIGKHLWLCVRKCIGEKNLQPWNCIVWRWSISPHTDPVVPLPNGLFKASKWGWS